MDTCRGSAACQFIERSRRLAGTHCGVQSARQGARRTIAHQAQPCARSALRATGRRASAYALQLASQVKWKTYLGFNEAPGGVGFDSLSLSPLAPPGMRPAPGMQPLSASLVPSRQSSSREFSPRHPVYVSPLYSCRACPESMHHLDSPPRACGPPRSRHMSRA